MDALFDYGKFFRNLVRKWFGVQNNMPNHSLTDKELTTTLKRWIGLGWLFHEKKHCTFSGRAERSYDVVRLTAAGGQIWQQERQPIWDRYCKVYPLRVKPGRMMMEVSSVKEAAIADYVQSIPERVWSSDTHRIREPNLLYWRSFESTFVGVMIMEDKNSFSWEEHTQRTANEADREQNRTWWQTVFELQRFQPQGNCNA